MGEVLVEVFLLVKVALLRVDITKYTQWENKSLYDTWDIFELIRGC